MMNSQHTHLLHLKRLGRRALHCDESQSTNDALPPLRWHDSRTQLFKHLQDVYVMILSFIVALQRGHFAHATAQDLHTAKRC
jgi:hypothetical protein